MVLVFSFLSGVIQLRQDIKIQLHSSSHVPDSSKVDIRYIEKRLKSFQITGEEAKQLYYFIMLKPLILP
jgi:hypothetical protein